MELDDDCTTSILESLHQRVAKLEDVWKVGYETDDVWNVGYKIADDRQPFELVLNGKKVSPLNSLIPAIQSMGGTVKGEIWINPLEKVDKVGRMFRVDMEREVMVRDSSNGMPCLLIVTRGKINGRNVILKFRLVENYSEDMTEMEAKHALGTSFDKNIRGLFPALYAVMKFKTTSNGGPSYLRIKPGGNMTPPGPPPDTLPQKQMVWECIATEPMVELTRDDMSSVNIQMECCRLLRSLHSSGYMHGDPHFGNFMKKSVGKDLKGDDIFVVYMIDQDEIRKLPVYDTVLSNLLQIVDFQTFTMWNNPRCKAIHKIESEKATDGDMIRVFQRMWKYFRYNTYIFGPEPFWHYKGLNLKALKARLPTEYVQLLSRKEVNTEEIYRRFVKVVESNNNMLGMSELMMHAWHNTLPQYYIQLPDPPK